MKKKEILKRVGNMQQLAYVRPLVYQEGRAEGMRAYEVKNGPLEFSVMADKCLDLSKVSFMGHNMNFLSKPGLTGRGHYDTHGAEAQRSIMGGMMFTCGFENVGAPCNMDGVDYPMHGRMRTTPAEHVCADAYWDEEDYEIILSGEMREAELFGENMTLRRTIRTTYGKTEIRIKDIITNEGYRPEPMLILYHINVGYPLLDEDCKIILPTLEVEGRDEEADRHLEGYDTMRSPIDGEPEYVFSHNLEMDVEGNTFAAVINEKLNIGLKISFSKKTLPYFMEWQSLASGDYVLGLEPANCSVFGRSYHMERNDARILEPFESEEIEIVLRFLTGEELKKLCKKREKKDD